MAAKKAAKKVTPKKATPKKATPKKATPKKASAKKAPAKKAPAKKQVAAVKAPMTKAVVISEIAGNTGLNKKQVNSVIDELANIIDRHVKRRSPGKFILPGLIKIQVKQKPASKARKGINPFTGEMTTFKAKPARRVVKVTPLKKLKEMAE